MFSLACWCLRNGVFTLLVLCVTRVHVNALSVTPQSQERAELEHRLAMAEKRIRDLEPVIPDATDLKVERAVQRHAARISFQLALFRFRLVHLLDS